MAIKSINVNNFAMRALLAAGAVVCLVGIVFILRWCAGNVISQNTFYLEVSDWALTLAPDDPQTHYTAAVLLEKTFQPDNLTKSLAEYERATALAPNDFRTWTALGVARERSGDADGGEKALRQALRLAPNYSEVKWILGNILLRGGKREEAFAEMRGAAETDSKYTAPAVATMWQLFGGDMSQVKRYLGDSPPVKATLMAFLVRENRLDDAVAVWKSMPDEQRKTTFSASGDQLFSIFVGAGKYSDALQILAQTGNDKFAAGKIFNGGFETDVKAVGAEIFDWRIDGGMQPQISIDDAQKNGGAHSLVVVFNSATGREFRGVSQTVIVEPGKKYVFEMFYKSELKTTATLNWQIAAAMGGKILATTPAVAATVGWTSLRMEFTAPERTEAVVINTAREACKTTLCPISGRIWFDDFSLSSGN